MGVLSRTLELAGLSTVSISLVREHTAKLKPPRALWVPFPFGLPLGHPHDADEQRRVLAAAFALLEAEGPVLSDYVDPLARDEYGAPLQAADITIATEATQLDAATEVTSMRRYWEMRVKRTNRTAVGVCGVPPQRFRGIVRFLEAFCDDPSSDYDERPSGVTKSDFLRQCSDDLKALYFEARMHIEEAESSADRERWLWGSTALGVLLRKVRDRLEASDDPYDRKIAFAIAR